MQSKRDSFKSRWGFILACIGSAVGMGNLWMFPQRVSKYGGGTFLIPYLFFVFIIASSGVIGEMAFGRWAKSGPVGSFSKAFDKKGNRKIGEILGCVPVIGSLALAIGYSVVVAWILKYMIGAFTGSVLNPSSVLSNVASDNGIDAFASAFGKMASPFGNNGFLWFVIAITTLILALGIAGGIERANKFMMPLFFLLFLFLCIYIATQENAIEGYKYIFTFDIKGWADPNTWIYAMGQAFFSLSVAGNGTLIYGSYLSDNEDIPNSAFNVALFDTLAAMLAALVIIPAMATVGEQLNSGGPGLLFIYLPHLFRNMPAGALITIVFFIATFFAGMTSLINLYEAPIATLQEKLGLNRATASLTIAGIAIIVSTIIQGIIAQWMDAVSIYICPLGAAMAGIIFFWIYGEKNATIEITKGRKKPLPFWIMPLSKYLYCLLAILVLLLGAFYGGIG